MQSLQITNMQWDLSHFCGHPSAVLPCFSEAARELRWKWVCYLNVFLLLVTAEPCSLQGLGGYFLACNATLKLE